MERGVVVGGLMICGSFLLAASLNRSAVEEAPADEPAAAQAQVIPPMRAAHVEDQPKPPPCAPDASNSGEPVEADEQRQGDLPGNGREACSQ